MVPEDDVRQGKGATFWKAKSRNMGAEALKRTSNISKWTALVLIEVTIGMCSFMLPLKLAVLLLLLAPIVFVLVANPLYAYLAGIMLLPVWSLTLTGQAEVHGQAEIRFSDACFFIAGLGWLASGVINRRLEVKGSALDLPLIAFFCWLFLSISWSPTFSGGVKEFVRKLNGLFIFYVTTNVIRSRKDVDFAVAVWIVSGFVASLVAFHELIAQILQIAGGLSTAAIRRWGWMRAMAFKESPGMLGFFLNACLMMAIAQSFLMKKARHRILLVCLIVVMICAIISTLSRISVMGLVIGTAFLLFFVRKGWKKVLVIGAMATTLLLFLGGTDYVEVLSKRYMGIVTLYETKGFTGRTHIWQVAAKIFEEHPIMGVGVGGFYVISEAYGAERLRAPHNLYIYIAGELGMIGFLLFTAVGVKFIMLGRQGLQFVLSQRERFVLIALLAGTFLYAFQALTVNFVLREGEFWALFGLTVAAIRIFSQEKTSSGVPTSKTT